jgi:hypothetical protein
MELLVVALVWAPSIFALGSIVALCIVERKRK